MRIIAAKCYNDRQGPGMPDKPLWLARLPQAIDELGSSSDPWVDRTRVESLLGVGRRRAQQLLADVATRRVGASRVALAADLIAHLQKLAESEQAYYDARRRKQLWDRLSEERRQWIEQPPVLVSVSRSTLRQVEQRDFDGLPDGVELHPGRIQLSFDTPEEALEKLVALAVAISRNRKAFDERVSNTPTSLPGYSDS